MQDHTPNNADLIKRLRDILGMDVLGDFQLTEGMNFTYSWCNGYEKLSVSYSNRKGGQDYSGMHHPDAVCVGNPCHYCGVASWSDND